MKQLTFYILLLLISRQYSYAQNPADCIGAQPVCNNPNFTFSATPNNGNINELPGTNSVSNPAVNPASPNFGCLLVGENNPQWLLVNISSSGILEFSFGAAGSPNPQAGLYDWAMWPYTSSTCNDIINNILPPVRCNWNSSSIGGTGIGTIPPGGNAGNYEPALAVVAGQQFVICISNFSGVNTQVTFTSSGTAQIGCNAVFANSATICPNQHATITPSVINMSNPSYTIHPGNLVFNTPTISLTSSVTQIYTISAHSANSATSPVTSNTFILSVINTQSILITHAINYCMGQPIMLTAPVGLNGYTLSGPNGVNQNGNQNSFILGTATSSLNGTYTITANNQNGCLAMGVTPVNVLSAPTPSFSGNNSVCQNSTLFLNAIVPNATSYNWQGPSNFSANTSSITRSGMQLIHSGIYSLNTLVNLGPIVCPSSNAISIIVHTLSPLITTNTQSICMGNSLVLNSSATTANSFIWNGPNAFVSNLQNPVIHNISSLQAGIYTVTAFFTINTLTCVSKNTTSVFVDQGIDLILPATTTFCNSSDIDLKGPSGAKAYKWMGPVNFLSNTKDLQIKNSDHFHSGTYTLQLTTQLNCTVTRTTQIQILPKLKLTTIPKNKTICKYNETDNSIAATGGSGKYVFSYSPMNGITHYGGDVVYLSPQTTTHYTAQVTDPACPTSTLSSSFWITVLPLPETELSSNLLKGCEPLEVKLTSNSLANGAKTTWHVNTKNTPGNTITHLFKNAGNYTLTATVKDSFGCSATHLAPFTIQVYPQPHAGFHHTPENITTIDNRATFIPNAREGRIKKTMWYFSANARDTSSILSPSMEFNTPSWHQVALVLENEFGCVDTVIKFIEVKEETLIYVPNTFTPNNDSLNDEFIPKGEGLKKDDYELTIFNRWGICIFRSTDPEKGWNGKLEGVDVKEDIYLYKIRYSFENSSRLKELSGHISLLR